MSTKSKSIFKKILSSVLSAACMLSGSAVFTSAVMSSAPAEVAAATESAAPGVTNTSDHVFSWDNATVYFLLTDRFCNGDTSNDHAYGRGMKNGSVVSGYKTEAAFQGGDFAGITQKINEGYFDDLGVNAIWLSAPYEQIHGYIVGGNGDPSFPHWSYHGYYVLDYTETDKNFGTKAEFKTMVDTAHEHGIRIVCDIVMNHAGYNDLQTMSEYDFCPASGWEDYYYSCQDTSNSKYHSYIDYTESSASYWLKWWGPDWIRCGLPGGYQSGSGEVAGSLEGLPDFKTESGTSVGIPEVLKTKWTKEGTLNEKVSKYGSSGTVRSYLVKWLTEWVKEFGVDGFRCDTAKHVEMESWVALKNAGKEALKEWRQNNPSAPGASWTDDFWMTGECFGHKAEKSNYFTSGAFDSMINFSFTGVGSCNVPGAGSVDGVYSDYASRFNNDPSFNMLTYLASHDTTLITGDRKYAGSFMLMCPGGIQIYYGDESNRPMAQVSSDSTTGAGHKFRSFMNWDSMDKDVLAHWQKLGQFRNNHLSVGGGAHKVISAYDSSTGYSFSRTYSKNGVEDKIVATLFAPANTQITIDVSGVFSDGTEVTNFYDDTTAKVSGGKVTFNSGANGTILIQEPDGEKGRVTVTHIDQDSGKTIKTETMSGLVGASYTVSPLTQDGFKLAKTVGQTSGTFSKDGAEVTFYYAFDDDNYAYVVIKHVDASNGSELADSTTEVAKIGSTISASPATIKNYEVDLASSTGVSGTVKKGTNNVVFKYTYVEPTNLRVHYYNANGWSSVKIYAYDESGATVKEFTGPWASAKEMTAEGDGWFYAEVPDTESATVIFHNGAGAQEPSGVGTPGYNCSGEVWLKDGKQMTASTVVVMYTGSDGKTLGSVKLSGMQGDSYKTEAKTFAGYTLASTPANATGTFGASTITVTYVYDPDEKELTNDSTAAPTSVDVGDTVTLKGAASGGKAPYQFSYAYKSSSASSYTSIKAYSTTTSATFTPSAKGDYTVKISVKDSAGTVKDKTFAISVSGDTPDPLVNSSKISASSITLGNTVTVTGVASGGTSPYKYGVWYKKASSSDYTKVQDYSTTKTITVKPTTATKYNIRVKVKDSAGTVKTKDFTVTVNPGVLTNKSTISATTVTVGKSLTVTGAATGGTTPYKYAVYYKKTSASNYTLVRDYSTTKTITVTPKTATTYNVRVKVKDAAGTVVNKDFKITAKAAALENTSKLSATTVTLGKSITITGAATGGTSPYKYSAWYKKASASEYTKLRDFSTTTTMTFKPASAVKYNLRVKVKDAKDTVKVKDFTVTVNPAPLANTSTLSATSIVLGEKVTLKFSATGGKTTYKYAAYYKSSTSDSYSKIRDYSTTASTTFKPTTKGTYTIRMKVKDAADTVVNKDVTLKVTANTSTTELANTSTVSATSIKLGSSVKVTCASTGGTKPVVYYVGYKKASSSEYTKSQAYSTNTSVTIKPGSAVKYNIIVKAKDANGTIKPKTFTISVTS